MNAHDWKPEIIEAEEPKKQTPGRVPLSVFRQLKSILALYGWPWDKYELEVAKSFIKHYEKKKKEEKKE